MGFWGDVGTVISFAAPIAGEALLGPAGGMIGGAVGNMADSALHGDTSIGTLAKAGGEGALGGLIGGGIGGLADKIAAKGVSLFATKVSSAAFDDAIKVATRAFDSGPADRLISWQASGRILSKIGTSDFGRNALALAGAGYGAGSRMLNMQWPAPPINWYWVGNNVACLGQGNFKVESPGGGFLKEPVDDISQQAKNYYGGGSQSGLAQTLGANYMLYSPNGKPTAQSLTPIPKFSPQVSADSVVTATYKALANQLGEMADNFMTYEKSVISATKDVATVKSKGMEGINNIISDINNNMSQLTVQGDIGNPEVLSKNDSEFLDLVGEGVDAVAENQSNATQGAQKSASTVNSTTQQIQAMQKELQELSSKLSSAVSQISASGGSGSTAADTAATGQDAQAAQDALDGVDGTSGTDGSDGTDGTSGDPASSLDSTGDSGLGDTSGDTGLDDATSPLDTTAADDGLDSSGLDSSGLDSSMEEMMEMLPEMMMMPMMDMPMMQGMFNQNKNQNTSPDDDHDDDYEDSPPIYNQPAPAAAAPPASPDVTQPGQQGPPPGATAPPPAGAPSGRVPGPDGSVNYTFPDGRTQKVSAVVAQALDAAFAGSATTDAQAAYANTSAKWDPNKDPGDRVDPYKLMTGDVARWDHGRTALLAVFGNATGGQLEAIVDGQLQQFQPEMHDSQGDFGSFAGFFHPHGIEIPGTGGGGVSAGPDPGNQMPSDGSSMDPSTTTMPDPSSIIDPSMSMSMPPLS